MCQCAALARRFYFGARGAASANSFTIAAECTSS
jgi:hypothetical protein